MARPSADTYLDPTSLSLRPRNRAPARSREPVFEVPQARDHRFMTPTLLLIAVALAAAGLLGVLSEVRGLGPLVGKPYTREDLAAVL